ncbi:MAG: hypothetical protein CM15mP122_5650 [Bacteroidota bacterium]|nr:MAG: hypothetical protein CM15mP122_5650 [Bacteroidota bacterium]
MANYFICSLRKRGAGFSAIDVTTPLPLGGKGPIHMFSVFNDRINSRVLVADVNGDVEYYEYNKSSTNLGESAEGEVAIDNYQEAREKDDEENKKLIHQENLLQNKMR